MKIIDTRTFAVNKNCNMMIKKKKIPSNALQVKIATIFNNLNELNLKQKCYEIREILTDDYWPWTAQCLVTRYVSIELNFHILYSNFLDYLEMPQVHKMVAQETYQTIRVLLQNDEKSVDFSDRSLLKNLGHWLGILTLRKNKPILQADIDIKSLLLEAYHKGEQELFYVVPFVTKILENCAQSRIFRPPNPWTMAIINILVELWQNMNIKLTIKFEIEVLCKTLNVNMAEVRSKNYLQNSEKLGFLQHQLTNDYRQNINQDFLEQHINAPLVRRRAFRSTLFIDTITFFSTILPENFVIDNRLPLLQTCPYLKKLVRPVIEQTIREWIHPVTEKSLRISLTTTEHIIRKDFALDSDITRMKIAARQMVSTLTAGIAMIMSTDQILISINNNLKQAFLSAFAGRFPPQKNLLDQTVNIVAANNLELTRAFIQKNAIEKAVFEIDKRLFKEVQLRKNAHLSGSGYFNSEAISQAEKIPEKIRLKTDGVTSQQMIVYQEFEKNIFNFQLLDRAPTVLTVNVKSTINQEPDYNGNNATLLEKTEFLLQEWITIYQCYQNSHNLTKFFKIYVKKMNAQGIFRTDDSLTKFFKMSTRKCIDYCYHILADSNQTTSDTYTKCFLSLDALARLMALFVKHSGNVTNFSTKINLLNKILEIIAETLLKDHEVRGVTFQELPYHRIFITLFLELCAPEPFLDIINYQVLISFCYIFHIIRPDKVSGFSCAWLEFLSHKVFVGRMITLTSQQKCQRMYARLLTDLLRYLAPHLRRPMITNSCLKLYKGTLHILLILFHDFSEVLSDYYYELCDVIPLNCIQMKNIILSALPKDVKLPKPSSSLSDIKIEMPREIAHTLCTIQPLIFKGELDLYLRTQTPDNFFTELKNRLYGVHAGIRYNIQCINALVIYLGDKAVTTVFSRGRKLNVTTIKNSVHMEIFQSLLEDFDIEGRYILLSSIVNHLRYPNAYTHYFGYILLCLFIKTNSEVVQEQITRILLERLMVNKPHPWGLFVTFAELIKNPIYKFWTCSFVHCAPDFKRLFNSVTGSLEFQRQLELLSIE